MDSETVSPGRAVRVLVVEDHEDTAATLAMLLRLYGHVVEVAADGPSALRAVLANPPDVVLLDIGLPKMHGWLVAQQIRQRSNGKRPLLVAVTGYGMQRDRLRSIEAGIDLHLLKPVDPVALQALLKRFQRIVGGNEETLPYVGPVLARGDAQMGPISEARGR